MRASIIATLTATAALGLIACHHTPPANTGSPPDRPMPPPPPPPTGPMQDHPSPDPGAGADPSPVTDGDITDAWVHGIHILVRRVPGSESTATQLYLRGGARN